MFRRQISEDTKEKNCALRGRIGLVVVIAGQHVLLWSSIYVLSSNVYILITTPMDGRTLTSTSLMAISGCVSLIYLGLHSTTSYLLTRRALQSGENPHARLQRLSTLFIRFGVALWLITFGLAVAFVLARHPSCTSSDSSAVRAFDVGVTCYMQRSSLAASLFALLTLCVLCVLMSRIEEPFRCSLLGVIKQQPMLPLSLPYKASIIRPMFSEMSFKCRSSTSLSSKTLVPSLSDSTTTLLPLKLEKGGLGIYAPKCSVPSFLAPRPSLSSIRSYTETISTQPASSLLPPLPAHISDKHRRGNAMCAAVHPQCRPARYHRSRKEQSLRISPPSPALSVANVVTLNQSQASLSSIYSQSISGKRYSIGSEQQLDTQSNRDCSSESTSTVVLKTPGTVRLIGFAGTFGKMEEKSIEADNKSDSDIDDATTL